MTVIAMPGADDPDRTITFSGYFRGLTAQASGDGEVLIKVGVPHDQADNAWPIRQLVGLMLEFSVTVPEVPDLFGGEVTW